MVDFDEKEISALENVFPGILGFSLWLSPKTLITHLDFQLPLQQTELKTAKINFRATLKELYDLSYLLKDTESYKVIKTQKNYKFNGKTN